VLDAGLAARPPGPGPGWNAAGSVSPRQTDPDAGSGARAELPTGEYRITFDNGGYFAATTQRGSTRRSVVVFSVTEAARHHHVPLLLSPFAYSTYLGS